MIFHELWSSNAGDFSAESWEGATDDGFASLRPKHLLDKTNNTS
jgi:hypothetical protein